LFAIGSDQRIWSASKDGANGTWSAFQAVPGNSAIQQVTADAMGDKVRLFAIGGDVQLWTSTVDYSGYRILTAKAFGTCLLLFAIGGDDRIWTTTGDYTAGTWSTFYAVPDAAGVKQVTA
ncbi:hypothetical protein PUR71_02790, partial [Streptomyces sp. SP17BM10]|nr:hypothetical protein [Streptomyces sp. SP17BM10]